MTTHQLHRDYVETMFEARPMTAIAHAEQMAMAESIKAEKEEWIKLSIDLSEKYAQKKAAVNFHL